MLAHVVLITVRLRRHGASERPRPSSGTWSSTYPGMLLATAGTVALLILVVVTSIRAARRRLRYESWHLLHLYAYLGVGLALPHQLWTGADFVSSPAAQAYWWTLYAVAAGSVSWSSGSACRCGAPAAPARGSAASSPRRPGVISVYLRGRRPATGCRCGPGSSSSGGSSTGRGWTRAHPYSLSAAPPAGPAADHGEGPRRRQRSRGRACGPAPGSLIEGPYGRLTGERYPGGRGHLLASGIGITPLRALLEELPYRPGEATLVYRARERAADLAFRSGARVVSPPTAASAVALPARAAGCPAVVAAARRWPSTSDAAVLRRLVARHRPHDVYVCGPTPGPRPPGPPLATPGVAGRPHPHRTLRLVATHGGHDMRRITMWLLSTVAALVLLFSYRTSTMGAGRRRPRRPATSPDGSAAAAAGGSGGSAGGGGTGSGAGGAGTYNGSGGADPVGPGAGRHHRRRRQDHRRRRAVQYPTATGATSRSTPTPCRSWSGRPSSAQSAHIDTVSGATVTSDGYIQSLQAAIDAAHLVMPQPPTGRPAAAPGSSTSWGCR